MTHRCIAFACQNEAHSGSNLCYQHITARPLEEAKEDLELMKEELQTLRNYSCVLVRELESFEESMKHAKEDVNRIKRIVERKELAVKKFERELSRLE
jgi:hypothetical protein